MYIVLDFDSNRTVRNYDDDDDNGDDNGIDKYLSHQFI